MFANHLPNPLPAPDQPLTLLGGLTPQQFMSRHWQKKPLLVRGAIPGAAGGEVLVRHSVKAARRAARVKLTPNKK